ncbi:hypothetical protein [Alteribacter keqinensis]|uniref:Uncharacterized protein n=1 Tax=Alteribacter keqinensis TaxID=2483800 RepID=A0A3M7TY21_9BACI|nr:hypothetical protein [Alteribacter keqinensis]RNA70191.1 hypothetical protein EBO34_09770 [Alteribacter keqinensis]
MARPIIIVLSSVGTVSGFVWLVIDLIRTGGFTLGAFILSIFSAVVFFLALASRPTFNVVDHEKEK